MYNARTWVNGEIADADKLNHMESGISESIPNDAGSVATDNMADLSVTYDKIAVSVLNGMRMCADGQLLVDVTEYQEISFVIDGNNAVLKNTYSKSRQIDCRFASKVAFDGNSAQRTFVTFVKQALPSNLANGASISSYLATGETGRHEIAPNATTTLIVPSDAIMMIVHTHTSSNLDCTPASVTEYSYIGTLVYNITSVTLTQGGEGE